MDLLEKFKTKGFVKFPFSAPESFLPMLEATADCCLTPESPGKRHLAGVHLPLAKLLNEERIRTVLEKFFHGPFRPVRTIYFNKNLMANWFVPWHQDLTVALKRNQPHPDFSNWTVKNNVPHAEAPFSLLSKMATLRIFLDSADQTNGAMHVIPGSHKNGKLNQEKIKKLFPLKTEEIYFEGHKGTFYLFSPLLLHRSGKSKTANPRRVLQIEMASENSLPSPLEWYEDAQIIPPTS